MTTPLGKAPVLSDDDLDAMAEITPQDVAEAAEFWDASAPEDARGLLSAEIDEEGENP